MPAQKINHLEILNQQQQDFADHIYALKNKISDLETLINTQVELNKKVSEKLAEAVTKNYDLDALKKSADKKFGEANALEAVASQKAKQLDAEIKRAEQRNKEISVSERSIASQKEQLIAREAEINEALKWQKMEERALKATRYEIDKLIQDNKLQEHFKGKL